MTIVAIDPGAAGGVAWKDDFDFTRVQPMPETRKGLILLLKMINPDVAYVERPAAFIPGGGYSQGFAFGQSVERPGCILETLGVRTIEVPPQRWQKALGMGKSDRVKDAPDATPESKKATKRHNAKAKQAWKNKLKSEAERRYPSCSVTLKTCDALLILDYAKIQERQ